MTKLVHVFFRKLFSSIWLIRWRSIWRRLRSRMEASQQDRRGKNVEGRVHGAEGFSGGGGHYERFEALELSTAAG